MSVKSNKNFQNIKDIDENLTKESHETNKSEISGCSRFLIQLYQILEDKNNENIIHWGDDGKYFIITNIYDFTEKILPKYYNHNNYASFVRQLNKYNFHKIKSQINENAFQNNQFIKGKKQLISNIFRKKKRKRDIKNETENITSLVKYKKNNFLDNINNLGRNNENNNNFSFDKHSLSLDEENENNSNNTFYNLDNKGNNFIKNSSNSIPMINNQINPLILKKNLMDESTEFKITNPKKISKKTVNDLLNDIVNKTDKITRKQKMLNAKFDSLSSKNIEYINKNSMILKEIESKADNNKKLEKFISFILEFKNINRMQNRLLPDDKNIIQKSESNDSLLNNINIINSAEPPKKENKIANTTKYLNKKVNENEYESFQSFFKKYFERKKNKNLLMNSDNKTNKNSNSEQSNKNNISISQKSNPINSDNISKINDNLFKDRLNIEERNSIDNASSIFKRNRSNSFHSSFSNNISDNFNNNDNFLLWNNNQNEYNINNRSEIIWNNNIDSNNIRNSINKSFDADSSQDKNSDRKDSLNNSSYSFIDIPKRTDIINNK